ncbi:MAG: MFS transporter [Gammaproteobacteria bacterium]|nr:MFS transporter [Gammaproteobacteria bacterium]
MQASAPATIENVPGPDRLRWIEKLGYGLGDFGSNMVWGMSITFLLYFYTDVFGISAAAAGTLLLVARVFDAVLDPVMGLITERVTTRWGKFRPYLLFGTPLLAALLVLTFTTPQFDYRGRLIYAWVTYILLGVVYTVVNLPYGALAPTQTQNPDDRNALSMYRSLGARAGDGLLVGLATTPLVLVLGNGDAALGFQLTALIYALIGWACLWFTFATCKERHVAPAGHKLSLREFAAVLRGNGPFFLLFLCFLFFVSAVFTRNSATVYYMTYNVARPDLIGPLLATGTVTSLAGIACSQVLARRLGKRGTFIFGLAGFALCGLAMHATPWSAVGILFAWYALGYVAFGLSFGLFWSLIADTVEYGEWHTGIRAEGAIYSIASFLLKLCSAVAGVVPAAVLSFSGYVPNAAQTDSALHGINGVMTLLPALFSLLAIVPLLRYRLDEKQFQRIVSELHGVRSGNNAASAHSTST